jgi:hypothetical protein
LRRCAQVSISDEVDFNTHTYQQDFHVAPNPRKIIQLDASGKQGRYVRIQLLEVLVLLFKNLPSVLPSTA